MIVYQCVGIKEILNWTHNRPKEIEIFINIKEESIKLHRVLINFSSVSQQIFKLICDVISHGYFSQKAQDIFLNWFLLFLIFSHDKNQPKPLKRECNFIGFRSLTRSPQHTNFPSCFLFADCARQYSVLRSSTMKQNPASSHHTFTCAPELISLLNICCQKCAISSLSCLDLFSHHWNNIFHFFATHRSEWWAEPHRHRRTATI